MSGVRVSFSFLTPSCWLLILVVLSHLLFRQKLSELKRNFFALGAERLIKTKHHLDVGARRKVPLFADALPFADEVKQRRAIQHRQTIQLIHRWAGFVGFEAANVA